MFSPDGKTLAGSSIGTDLNGPPSIELWDVASHSVIADLKSDGQTVNSVAFSPTGKTLASSDNETVRLWNVAKQTQTTVLTGHTSAVASVAFSPDGKTLASGSGDNTIRLWTLRRR